MAFAGAPVGVSALQCVVSHPSLKLAKLPRPLAIETFLAARGDSWGHRISPDGDQLLWLALERGRATVHVRRLGSGLTRTIEAESPINWVYWASDSRHVIGWRDTRGDENYQPWVSDSARHEPRFRRLIAQDKVRVFFQQQLSDGRLELLVRHNRRDPKISDLYRIDLRTGAETRVATNPGSVDLWVTDQNGKPVLRRHRQPDFSWTMEISADSGWRQLLTGAADETFEPQGHPLPGARAVWALSNRGRDRIAVVRYDVVTGTETVLYEHADVDVASVLIDDLTYQPLLANAWPDYPLSHVFNPGIASVLSAVTPDHHAGVTLTSISDDNSRFVASIETPRTGTITVLAGRRQARPRVLSKSPVGRHAEQLSAMRPIVFQSRDGLQIHGYLTVPQGTAGRALPAVILVHGGPFSRDRWGYHALDQHLSNRGYAVLRVNFRGSSGYGRRFREAARREFGRRMQDDLIDAADWLTEQGIADPEHVAIYGRSYGGYAALMGLARTPEYFAAGVDIMGPVDLASVIESGPAYWHLYRPYWFRFIGNPANADDRREMTARSPMTVLDKIRRPLLVAHGGSDVRVARQQSDRMVTALRSRGVDVDYLVLEGEGHSIRSLRNQVRLSESTEQFLGRHLGGRVCR